MLLVFFVFCFFYCLPGLAPSAPAPAESARSPHGRRPRWGLQAGRACRRAGRNKGTGAEIRQAWSMAEHGSMQQPCNCRLPPGPTVAEGHQLPLKLLPADGRHAMLARALEHLLHYRVVVWWDGGTCSRGAQRVRGRWGAASTPAIVPPAATVPHCTAPGSRQQL